MNIQENIKLKIDKERYVDSVKRLPAEGQHILANQTNDNIVVYQAYNSTIADFAIHNQRLGGPAFSFGRMSWIKPNFLWMMYRCGWAEKENQERVLAFTISKVAFEEILKQAVFHHLIQLIIRIMKSGEHNLI